MIVRLACMIRHKQSQWSVSSKRQVHRNCQTEKPKKTSEVGGGRLNPYPVSAPCIYTSVFACRGKYTRSCRQKKFCDRVLYNNNYYSLGYIP